MTGPSKGYQQFIESLEAPLTTREAMEGLDVASLTQLEGEERERAQERLLTHLEQVADERAVRALAALPTQAASRGLKDVIKRWRGQTEMADSAAFEATQALIDRGELANPEDALLDFLQNGQARSRARAAEALAEYSGDRVVDALTGALDDADRHVRGRAAAALFAVSGLAAYAEVIGTELWLLKHWLASPYPGIRDAAVADLRQAVSDLEAGRLDPPPSQTPPRSPQMERFLDSKLSQPGEAPFAEDYDLEALEELTGVERDWVEFSLITQLPEGDPRVPRALAAMGSTRAKEPLSALLDQAPPAELRREAAGALEALEKAPLDRRSGTRE